MRLDDDLVYSPVYVYRVPGVLRYATKLALDARYGEEGWAAPYAPVIEVAPSTDLNVVSVLLRQNDNPNRNGDSFVREGVRQGDIATIRGRRVDAWSFDDIQYFQYVECLGDFREAPVRGVATVDFDFDGTPDGSEALGGTQLPAFELEETRPPK